MVYLAKEVENLHGDLRCARPLPPFSRREVRGRVIRFGELRVLPAPTERHKLRATMMIK
jgi:hypothetical protein